MIIKLLNLKLFVHRRPISFIFKKVWYNFKSYPLYRANKQCDDYEKEIISEWNIGMITIGYSIGDK